MSQSERSEGWEREVGSGRERGKSERGRVGCLYSRQDWWAGWLQRDEGGGGGLQALSRPKRHTKELQLGVTAAGGHQTA